MFRWTLKDNETGVIQKLAKDPRGWKDLTIKHERGEKWHGVTYDFTNEFGFFCKGAGKELIDEAYERNGQEADVTIKLEVKCNGSFTQLFTGKLDFATYRQEFISNVLYSFLAAEKDDLKILLNNREDTKVDILRNQSLGGVSLPSYPYDSYELSMHSKVIRMTSSWEADNTEACNTFETDAVLEIRVAEWIKILGELRDSNDVPVSFEGITSGTGTNITPILDFSDEYEFPIDVTVSWDVAGLFSDKSFLVSDACGDGLLSGVSRGTNGVNITLSLFKTKSQGGDLVTNTTRWDLVTIPAYSVLTDTYTAAFSNSGSITTQVERGERLFLFWLFSYKALASTGSPHDIQFAFEYTIADISATADTTTPPSSCTAAAIHEAWSKLSAIILDQPVAFYSEFLGRTDSNIVYDQDGCGSRLAITSGLNIRGFINSSIATSLKSMFEACNSVFAIGLGIEDYEGNRVIRVEPVYYFYQDVEILKLTNVPNIQMRHREDLVYNEVALGFQKWKTESTNGLDEPNAKIEYAIPDVKKTKNKYETMSPFVGGMYAIEQTRRKNHLEFTTEDTGYDEDIFFICLNKNDLTIPEKDENFSSVTGLLSPETAYNLRLMLSSTFDRVKYLFTAGLTKLGTLLNPVLMPAEGEGNEGVVYSFVPDGCDGDHFGTSQGNGRAGRYPHAQARREEPLWLPEEYTFQHPISFSEYVTLIQNPYGLIRFSPGDTDYFSGWLLSLEYNVRNKSGTFTVLRKNPNSQSGGNVMSNDGDYDGNDYDNNDYYTG